VNSEAHARVQGELQRDLTGIVVALVARYSGVPPQDLQQSEVVRDWIGQHLRTLTHDTPEWMQFVTLVGAKKLTRYLQIETVPPTPLDPFPTMATETLPLVIESAVSETVTVTEPTVVTTTLVDADTQAPIDVDAPEPEPEPQPEPIHPHVTFEPEASPLLLPKDPTDSPDKPKRKRTSTPRPPRTTDLTRPPPLKKIKPTPPSPSVPKPPKIPKAPKEKKEKKPKKMAPLPPSDLLPDDNHAQDLQALPEVVVP